MRPWIGVDLDGTLAVYGKWHGIKHIGEPVPAMLERVKRWLAEGKTVKIVTARVGATHADREEAAAYIRAWCLKHVGVELSVTDAKDSGMTQLWDDRAVRVEKNTGRIIAFDE